MVRAVRLASLLRLLLLAQLPTTTSTQRTLLVPHTWLCQLGRKNLEGSLECRPRRPPDHKVSPTVDPLVSSRFPVFYNCIFKHFAIFLLISVSVVN